MNGEVRKYIIQSRQYRPPPINLKALFESSLSSFLPLSNNGVPSRLSRIGSGVLLHKCRLSVLLQIMRLQSEFFYRNAAQLREHVFVDSNFELGE